jgi:hypothetical protein
MRVAQGKLKTLLYERAQSNIASVLARHWTGKGRKRPRRRPHDRRR